jgi:hypothetical protein
MSNVIVAGPDTPEIAPALDEAGATVTQIPGPVTTSSLRSAGIETADTFVLTDVTEATGIPLAKELNAEVQAVAYSEFSLPESMKGVADLAIDPNLMEPTIVAEELVDKAASGDS